MKKYKRAWNASRTVIITILITHIPLAGIILHFHFVY